MVELIVSLIFISLIWLTYYYTQVPIYRASRVATLVALTTIAAIILMTMSWTE